MSNGTYNYTPPPPQPDRTVSLSIYNAVRDERDQLQRNLNAAHERNLRMARECDEARDTIEKARIAAAAKPNETLISTINALRERAHDLANQVMRIEGELSQANRNLNHWREEAGKLHSKIDRLKAETLQAYGPGLYQVIGGFGPCPKVRNLTETHTAVENSELDVLKLGIHKAGVYVVNEGVTYYPHKDAVVLTNPPPPMDHGLWVQFYRDGITGDAVAWQPPADAQEAIREVSRGYGGLGVRIDLAKPGTERTTINVQYPQLQRRIERLEAWAAQFTPGVTTSVIARVGRDCVQVDPINGPGDFKTTYPAMPA